MKRYIINSLSIAVAVTACLYVTSCGSSYLVTSSPITLRSKSLGVTVPTADVREHSLTALACAIKAKPGWTLLSHDRGQSKITARVSGRAGVYVITFDMFRDGAMTVHRNSEQRLSRKRAQMLQNYLRVLEKFYHSFLVMEPESLAAEASKLGVDMYFVKSEKSAEARSKTQGSGM